MSLACVLDCVWLTKMLSGLNEVNDHLFISSVKAVSDVSLQEKQITCIINCSLMMPNYEISKIKYIPIMIEDHEGEDIHRYFDDATSLIHEEHKTGGKTLVYCVAGISRSATICIAYLMKYQELNLRNAFRHLRSRRRIIRPNNAFFKQLIEYEMELYNENSVKMVPIPNADSPDCMVPDVFYEVCKGMVWLRSCRNAFRR